MLVITFALNFWIFPPRPVWRDRKPKLISFNYQRIRALESTSKVSVTKLSFLMNTKLISLGIIRVQAFRHLSCLRKIKISFLALRVAVKGNFLSPSPQLLFIILYMLQGKLWQIKRINWAHGNLPSIVAHTRVEEAEEGITMVRDEVRKALDIRRRP